MHVCCCQYDIAWEDKAANYAKVRSLLAGAAVPKGSLVVLPEMSFTGFSMAVEHIAEAQDGPSVQFLRGTAREKQIYVIGGMVTRGANGRGRNQLVAYSPDGVELARYSKIQPFTLGRETEHYTGGDSVVTFQCGACVVAPFICYDLRFPELFRMAAWRRPELYVVIANWPNTRLHHWVKLLQARAIENQAYVLGVNRVGDDPRYQHSGRSMIVSPHGEIMADAGNTEQMVGVDLDLGFLARYRTEVPFLADMSAQYVRHPE